MTKKICNVLSMVVFLGLLVIAGFLFVPKILGYHEYAVLSGSMEPGIPVGAIVYDKNFSESEARDGAVVTCGGVRCFDRADPLKLHPGYFRGG